MNTKSEVDENLFGAPNRLTHAQQMRENKSSNSNSFEVIVSQWNMLNLLQLKPDSSVDLRKAASMELSSPDRNRKPHPKEYIKHITKDLIREIL